MFNENSIVVRTWADMVTTEKCTLDQVPDLFNLWEVVAGMVTQQ